QGGSHRQPPSAWIRAILSLLAVPSRHWNCAICAHNTAFVGRPLLNKQGGSHRQPPSAWIRAILSLLAVPSRHWNCAICAHNTAFVGRPLLNKDERGKVDDEEKVPPPAPALKVAPVMVRNHGNIKKIFQFILNKLQGLVSMKRS
ncbi:hypothetical protein CDAR_561451, partial [Caerostris darwini]